MDLSNSVGISDFSNGQSTPKLHRSKETLTTA